MRFVDDDQIPRALGNRGQLFGALDVVDRGDGERDRQPRVDADWQRRREPPEQRSVDGRGVDRKAVRQLPRPLIAQPGGCEDENPFDSATSQQVGSNQSCLNGLSEADLICEEQTRRGAPEYGERWFELIGQEADTGRSPRTQRATRRGGGNQQAARASPAGASDKPRGAAPRD